MPTNNLGGDLYSQASGMTNAQLLSVAPLVSLNKQENTLQRFRDQTHLLPRSGNSHSDSN